MWSCCLCFSIIYSFYASVHASPEALQCRRNCSTTARGVAKLRGSSYPVSCFVAKEQCSSPQSVRPLNRLKPLYEPRPIYRYKPLKGWSLSTDPADNHTIIVLNVSFELTHDRTVFNLRGFEILIQNALTKKDKEKVFLCLNTKLEYYKHALAHFYYDCYGTTRSTHVAPGDRYVVSIWPASVFTKNNKNVTTEINIPDCSHRDLYPIYDCVVYRQLKVRVLNIFCNNATISFHYNLPEEYGDFAKFNLCQEGSDEVSCIQFIQDRNNNFLLYTLSDNYYNKTVTYTLQIRGLLSDRWVAYSHFSFASCSDEDSSKHSLSIALTISVLFLLIIATVFVYIVKNYFHNDTNEICKLLKQQASQSQLLVAASDVSPSGGENAERTPVTVYVVFVNDHREHQDVVLKFVNFLQKDLGFRVIFELWDEHITESSTCWMETSMKNADKIIVIWSPGATKRWNNRDTASGVPDFFTHVVIQIHRDLFNNTNQGKYFFTYFEYCNEGGRPVKDITDHIVRSFNLMSDFNDLYFHLVNQEVYAPGGISCVEKARPDTYYDRHINEVGPLLKEAIDRMCCFVESNQKWYESPDKSLTNGEYLSTLLPDGDGLVCRSLRIAPPSDEVLCNLDSEFEVTSIRSIEHEITSLSSADSNFRPASFSVDTVECSSEDLNNEVSSFIQGSTAEQDSGCVEDTSLISTNASLRLPFPERSHPRIYLEPVDYENNPNDVIDAINNRQVRLNE